MLAIECFEAHHNAFVLNWLLRWSGKGYVSTKPKVDANGRSATIGSNVPREKSNSRLRASRAALLRCLAVLDLAMNGK